MSKLKRILIIDEEDWYMEPIIIRFKRYGYEVNYIQDFEFAIDEIENNIDNYDIAIVDLKLPSGGRVVDNKKFPENGLFLINLIKIQKSGFSVIAFTVNRDADIKKRLQILNCERVLKGEDGEEIDRAVIKLLYS